MVEAMLKVEALKGLVLETFGAGNAPGGSDGALTRIFAQAIQKGIIIVNVTQCASPNSDQSTKELISAGMTGTVSPASVCAAMPRCTRPDRVTTPASSS